MQGSPGGLPIFSADQRIDADALTQIASVVQQTALDAVAASLFGEASGMLRGGGLTPGGGSGLTTSIAAGVGFLFDSTISDDYSPRYRPVIVSAGTVEHAARDAQPRIDRVVAYPATIDTATASRTVYSGGALNPVSVPTLRRWSATVAIVQGTPSGSPTPPATPSGAVSLGTVYVPVSGPAYFDTDKARVYVGNDVQPLVDTAQIADNAITYAKIGPLQVDPTAHIALGTVTHEHLNPSTRRMVPSVVPGAGSTRTYTIQASTPSGPTAPGYHYFRWRLINHATGESQATIKGTQLTGTDSGVNLGGSLSGGAKVGGVARTNGSGNFQLQIANTSGGAVTAMLEVEPIYFYGTSQQGLPGVRNVIQVDLT